MGRKRKVVIVLLLMLGAASIIVLLQNAFRATPLRTIKGAVVVGRDNVDREVPIAGVQVSIAGGLAEKDVRTSPTGYFVLSLARRAELRKPITLQFRDSQYLPLDVTSFLSDRLVVARMVPVAQFAGTGISLPQTTVSNVKIRYTVKTASIINVGSTLKTFHVVNFGNIPCNGRYPCSPDGKWRAAVGYFSLQAPAGDFFANARVSCIAGPCPFTKIRYDGFSRGGPSVRVEVLDWADTTVFLFEAEVFRSMTSDSVRLSYPVMFGQALHFTAPANAEGLCIEAEINRQPIVFPLGPQLNLGWATCTESVNPDHTEVFQCELKPGYGF